MSGPQASLRLGNCEITLLGTITGFVPDAARVTSAIESAKPSLIALGVPPEDLPGIAILAADATPERLIDPAERAPSRKAKGSEHGPIGGEGFGADPMKPTPRQPIPDDGDPHRFAGLDATTAHLLGLLRRFGATSPVPSDLLAAERAAKRFGIPVAAIDLDDAAHTSIVTKELGMLGLWGRSRAERRVLASSFADLHDAHDLAARFDTERAGTRGLRRIEEARETEMARRLRELAAAHARILAVVPAPRLAGVLRHLGQR